MKNEAFTVSLTKNPSITMKVIPGHFTTNHFHISHYLGLNNLKTNAYLARDVARELALPYLTSTLVDTIVCVEGTNVIGAYMAEELMLEGTSVINSGKEIRIVTPMSNINGELIFHSNMEKYILNQNIILLISSISSGRTLSKVLECLSYYAGRIVGISALFNAYPGKSKEEVNSMFTNEDIPGYQVFSPAQCVMCTESHELDAIIIDGGYTKI